MKEFLKILSLLGVSVDLNVDSLRNNIIIFASSIFSFSCCKFIMFYESYYVLWDFIYF